MPRRVLLVDNDQESLSNIQSALEPHFDVFPAATIDEAFDIIESQRPFKVITSDVNLPGLTLEEYHVRLRLEAPQSTVVCFSKDEAGRARYNRGRFTNTCLVYPFNMQRLTQTIEAFISTS